MGSMESATADWDSEEEWSKQGEEEDVYDPRNPDYILPASKLQVEEINIAMFEQQICRLQTAISHRASEDEELLLEHYRSVLFHLQCSLQAALHRRDQAGTADADPQSDSWFVPYFPSLPGMQYFHSEYGSSSMQV
mmetsp:Transcript_81332/g.157075  ORF Transcript_81332/g.157075 Transcript_81332/m.157075 type:complete len:136 (-) Transcript_81332:475-882(-)